jgi:bifunctional non-homologous end joining protein LigD
VPDRLDRYRQKRDPERTPEPFGPVRPDGAGVRRFVVQEHAARQHHFDFRLELHGTLRSWAVPKGPSADPSERRMAVEVEDHPVEYADFEGVIPAGNYGAGEVIVWDRGWWRALEDPDEGYQRGKLLFELGGYKLRGEWTLVRTRQPRQWLQGAGAPSPPPRSSPAGRWRRWRAAPGASPRRWPGPPPPGRRAGPSPLARPD